MPFHIFDSIHKKSKWVSSTVMALQVVKLQQRDDKSESLNLKLV